MITSIFVLALVGVAPDPTVMAEAIQLERAALERRQQLRSGIFEVEDSGLTRLSSGPTKYKNRVRIVLDGKNLRNDVHREQEFVTVRSRGPEYTVFFTDRPLPDGRKPAAIVAESAVAKQADRSEFIDPRLVGMVPSPFMILCFFKVDSYLGGANIKQVESVRDDVIDGVTCRRIDRTNTQGNPVRVWIDPARNFALLRCEVEAMNGPVTALYTIQVKYGAPQAGLWYPEAVDYTVREGDQTVEEDHATIRATHLNETIDPSLFGLASMGFARGTDISYQGKRAPAPQVQWDGAAIVPLDPKLVRRGMTRQHLFTAISAGCAVIAAVAVWLAFKPKSTVT